MSEENLKEVVRESSLGFHMVNTFQSCPRKWFIKYHAGILPVKIGKALILGKAWHAGMEVFYRGGTADEAYERIISDIDADKLNFRKLEEYGEILERVPILFRAWYEAIGKNLHAEYEVLAVEEELRPRLADTFTMTIRPDAVVKRRSDGAILIPEHKTTGYSVQSMFETVDAQDQATAYCWGLLETKPEYKLNFAGLLLDVVYNRGRVTDVQQLVIIRNKTILAEFELSLFGLFVELARRLVKLEANEDLAPLYFPRNGSACSTFGCEYADICRTRITKGMILGSNYFVDAWKGRETLLEQAKEALKNEV